jgi:signal transduction histidine kinase
MGLFADPTYLASWLSMTVAAGLLTIWAVRRLTMPVRVLAEAADALGRDVNAPPLPQGGPTEVARAAAAFNTMAERIRRFVSDRTFLLTAIGHDLRTPITRLKLRCEFIDDDEQRQRFLADLDELEAMVSATLAFGRDTARAEPETALDLGALLRTIVDDASDARPDANERIRFDPPESTTVTIRGRPIGLKRSFANLIGNAIAYAGNVTVSLGGPRDGEVTVTVEDDGPGIPAEHFERVFEPFQRLETSRSRETGGTGLGLPIARNIIRAHGGEITLTNRPTGGLCARVVLPV